MPDSPLPEGLVDYETLGQRIRRLRERKKLTLRALAQLVGLSAPFLHDVEMGRRNTDKLEDLARALGVEAGMLTEKDPRVAGTRVDQLERRVAMLEARLDSLVAAKPWKPWRA